MSNHEKEYLLGLDKSELISLGPRTSVHESVIEPLNELKEKAAEEGIELGVTGGFRDYDSQLKLWNEKVQTPPYRDFLPPNGSINCCTR